MICRSDKNAVIRLNYDAMNTNNAVSRPRIRGRSRRFRSLFIAAAGALILTAAFVPRANAILIVYYNFEDTFPDFTSETIPGQPQMQTPVLDTTYTLTDLRDRAGIPLNVFGTVPGDSGVDPDANNHGLGLVRSSVNSGAYFQFDVDATFLQGMSLSFAIATLGNGFDLVSFSYSIDGGSTFTAAGSFVLANIGPAIIVTFPVPVAVEGQSDVVLRLTFTGGHSNGVNDQNTIDNIRLDTQTIIPEPATVVGGLLGVCGLGWQQRRRLIRAVRFRRT
jgi:hypothetical protein